MRIQALYSYGRSGQPGRHKRLQLNLSGIEGNRPCSQWRQVLLLPGSTLERFKLPPTSLRENIVTAGSPDIHGLPSGTVIKCGDAELRLTFHCEPCTKLSRLITPKKLNHQRGYLAQIVHPGWVNEGDELIIQPPRFEAIPYTAKDRIRWYLDQLTQPIMAAELMDRIGLPKGYCRALPAILRNNPDLDASLILFATRGK